MTRPKRLSERKDFKSAIVVAAEWSNMAGIGETELAMTTRQGQVELWHWAADCGPADKIEGGACRSWRDAVDFLASNDELASCIDWHSVEVRGSPRFVGRLLALAWGDNDDRRVVARILCRFKDDVIAALDASGRGVWSEGLRAVLLEARARIEDEGLDIDDLPEETDVTRPTLSGIGASMDAAIEQLLEAQRAEEEKREEQRRVLAPWAEALAEMRRRWLLEHPPRRAGGLQYPPIGWSQLLTHVEQHILAHGALPGGVQHILSTPNSAAGRVADLEVNFDDLLRGIDCTSDTGNR